MKETDVKNENVFDANTDKFNGVIGDYENSAD